MIAQPLFALETRTRAALFLPEEITAGMGLTGVDGEQCRGSHLVLLGEDSLARAAAVEPHSVGLY